MNELVSEVLHWYKPVPPRPLAKKEVDVNRLVGQTDHAKGPLSS